MARVMARTVRPRRVLGALRDETGAVALEFALAVLPFLTFAFAILQVAFYHFALQNLDWATRSASRAIMLGRAQAQATSAEQFRTTLLCPALRMPLDSAKITVSISPVPRGAASASAPDISTFIRPEGPALVPANVDPGKSTYCLGAPGDILFIDVTYSLANVAGFIRGSLGDAIKDAMVLRSTNFIYNEPFQVASGNAPANC